MNKKMGLSFLGEFLLFSATIVWGSSFFILKETISNTPPIFIIGIRFFISSIIISLIFIKKIIKINKQTLLHGIVLGAILAVAYFLQTIGLKNTSPSKNAFLTSSYCVMCPFFVWAIRKIKPKSYNIISGVLCVLGIGLVAFSNSSSSEGSMLFGDIITVACAIFYALQIVFTNVFVEKNDDAVVLVVIELVVVGILLLGYSAIFELNRYGKESYNLDKDTFINVLYLTLACTLYAQTAQMFGIKFTNASRAAIILSLEAVFGTLFSIIFGNEKVVIQSLIGFSVIFIAMLISELKIDIFGIFKKKKE